MESFRQRPSLQATTLASGLTVLLLINTLPARAATPEVPWECSNYEGAAQTRCLNTFIEFQREKLEQLEGQLQAQKGAVNQLKNQVDRQAAATADLQRQLSDRPATSVIPPPYPYPYFYPQTYFYPPSLGLGFYFGRPWIYGPLNYYGPHWGPRYYRSWGHRR
jgi:uncharacterized coiled-coil protein SlyX